MTECAAADISDEGLFVIMFDALKQDMTRQRYSLGSGAFSMTCRRVLTNCAKVFRE
jgi:hypothetical protein